MSIWMIVQVVLNISLALIVYVIWVKLRRPPKDDPRLSRGLQLLQSKISVLEDLSNRTEVQVEQLNALMERKVKQVQSKLMDADVKMRQIEMAMNKSKEVAEIFQEEIPHDEIVKRQNTIKYIKAAKMANTGSTVDEIVEVIDLPVSEIELIAKLNKDNLVFDDDSLPEWAKEKSGSQIEEENFGPDFSNALQSNAPDYSSLKRLGDEFRQACTDYDIQKIEEEAPSQIAETVKNVKGKVSSLSSDIAGSIVEKVQKSLDSIGENMDFEQSKSEEELQAAEEVLPTEDVQENTESTLEIEEMPEEQEPMAVASTVEEDSVDKSTDTKDEPSLTLESISEMDSSAESLRKMQTNRRLTLKHNQESHSSSSSFKLPKSEVDVNKTLG